MLSCTGSNCSERRRMGASGDVGGGGDGGSVRRRGFGTESGMPGGERIEAHQRVFRKQICH